MKVCWESNQLSRILQPDAESIEDHVFNAVHCPTQLQIRDRVDGPLRKIEPSEFVDQFLLPDKEYVFTVVLGESGSGKSHLIQWLRLRVSERLKEDSRTLLVTVPRTGTSLRSILEQLISYLPDADGENYRNKLKGVAGQFQGEEAKVDMFLNALAHSLGHGSRQELPKFTKLARYLAVLLMDPTYRNELIQNKNGAAYLITRHVFDSAEDRKSTEDRREFNTNDLPEFNPLVNRVSEAARNAMDFIDAWGDDVAVVGLLNACLDDAIAYTLNFSADELINLMTAIRIDLKRQNKRLFLLMEDFARLQGIDTALLQALMTPNRQGDQELCELRWAMAVTTGYYQRFAETVKTRMTLIIDMDKSYFVGWSELTKGYLNALRVGEDRLRAEEDVSNACTNCDRKPQCHEAFGDIDGVGLYPFTQNAIKTMVNRVGGPSLTPRAFLNSILVKVLNASSEAAASGNPFPSDSLLQNFSSTNNQLGSTVKDDLRRMDPDMWHERKALLELWDGSGRIVNLPQGIHDFFGIPRLNEIDTPPTPPTPIDPVRPVRPDPPPPEDQDFIRLQRWVDDEQEQFSQELANRLRPLIYSALEEFIDWDRLGYQKSAVARSTAGNTVFRQRSISFERYEATYAPPTVSITLAASLDNSIALQALLLLSRNQNSMQFPDAGKYLPKLLDFLQRIAQEVEEQLAVIYKDTPDWSYTQAATELLALTAFQGGAIAENQAPEEVYAQIYNLNAPQVLRSQEQSLFTLNQSLVNSWSSGQELLKSFSSGTKGGQAGNYLRVAPMMTAIQLLIRNDWKLSHQPPQTESIKTQALRDFAGLYLRVKNGYDRSVSAEVSRWRAWGGGVADKLGAGVKFVDLKAPLENLKLLAFQKGVVAGNTGVPITNLLNEMDMRQCDAAVDAALKLPEKGVVSCLPRIFFILTQHNAIDRFGDLVGTFLANSRASIEAHKRELRVAGGEGLLANQESIRNSLSQIYQTLLAINLLCRR